MKKIPYGKHNITEEDIIAVTDVLRSDNLTQGGIIHEFEKAFAEYVGSKYAVAVSNGTTALHLCTEVLNVKPGDKVITTPITFVASANCIRYCGGEVIFSDISPDSFLIDIEKLRQLLKAAPKGTYKGIIPVDFAGLAVNLEELRGLADDFGLWIIEDACHAPGGYFVDSKSNKQYCGNGAFAELAIFSFHPVKHIACGEGGMITTNDISLYEKLLLLRTHGITKDPLKLSHNDGNWYYEMQELGYNYRLTDFQAALGKSQLGRAEHGLKRRIEIAAKYDKAFKNASFILNHSSLIDGHAYHLYIIQIEDRKGLYDFLRERHILCQVHYIPAHLQPYYASLGWKMGDLPVSEEYYQRCLSLPMYPTLSNEEQDFVIASIFDFFAYPK